MIAPRQREQRRPPSPPDRRPPRLGGGSSPYTYTAFAARRPAGFARPRVARRGLVGSARALSAAACLSLVGALALPTTALAQAAETLVSNIGQGNTTTREFSVPYAQRFTTGPYEYGYTLSTVDVVSADTEGTNFSVKVCTVDADNHPTSTCTNLAAPGSSGFAAGTITFYAPANYVLEAETTYTVVLTPPSQGDPKVTYGITTSNGEDAGKADGWSIADMFDYKFLGDPWETSPSNRKFRIAIKGSRAPEPETTENQPSEIRAYWIDSATNDGNLQADCAGTEPFRAYWKRPKRADEWEAKVTAEHGASNATHSNIGDIGDGFHELTGTVHVRDGEFGVVSIRVRGRFGDDGWGSWSRPTELFCVSPAQTALQGRFVSPPERHDGEKRIKVRVEFSEAPENVGADGVEVEGGAVTSVSPVGGNAPGGAGTRSNSRSIGNRNAGRQDGEVVWEFEIEPDSDGDVTVSIEAGRPCDEAGAICTADGRSLSEDISTTVEGPEEGPPPLTASFTGLPEAHDGESAFTLRMAFSEPLSWMNGRRLREDVVAVSGGRATEASRVDRRRDLWELTVEPDSGADVTVTLGAGAACGTPAAVCTSDGRALSETISATVAGPAVETAEAPLTASFEAVPGEHDGESAFTLKLAFSEPLSWMNSRRLRENVVAVSGGRATAASRVDRRRDLWQVTVEPDSLADVTVTLEAGAACGTPAAVCTSDGRALSNTISTTVRGPVAVSVADARAEEGADETIDFAVSLSRAGSGTVAVAYATADGTATAGEDYTARKGELTFDPGETEKTVSVPVLDDAIDEGEETFTLRLTNASGARIADGTATGTIENSDPLQKMWLSRFGRTVAGQVVDAVTGRLSGPTGGSQVTLGGQSIDLSALSAGSADARRSLAGALGAAKDDDPLAGPGAWEAARAGSWDDPETGATVRSLTGRELLLGSSFHLAAGGGEAGGPGYAAWGRVAVGGFDAEAPAENGDVRLDGEVTTGVLGADAQWERWLAGVALSVSEGDGSFDQPGVDSGTVESSLTSVNPYVRYEASDRLSVWGLVGYGTGDMTMTQAANDNRGKIVTRTDISMRLGAAGARGVLLKAGADGGIDLALRGDAFLVQMESEAAANTVETKADASRLRLVLEAGRSFALGPGAVLAPGLEVGLRHDGGDAETGTGVEVGGRIRYTDAGSGLTVEANARTLIAHEDSGYREWGAGGSVRLDPGASGRGLSLSLAPVWGTPSSGVDRLWSARDAAGLVRDDDFEAERRLEGELGYGFGAFGERGVVTPYAGLGLAEAGDRTWRAGARWSLAPHLAMSLDGARRESANDDAPEHAAQFRLTLRW